jgi:hypothetical protein
MEKIGSKKYTKAELKTLFSTVNVEECKSLIDPDSLSQFLKVLLTEEANAPLDDDADYAKIFEELQRFTNYFHVSFSKNTSTWPPVLPVQHTPK